MIDLDVIDEIANVSRQVRDNERSEDDLNSRKRWALMCFAAATGPFLAPDLSSESARDEAVQALDASLAAMGLEIARTA